jgi:hypothetical protein
MWQEFNIGKSENSIISWPYASHNNNAANYGHTSVDYELPMDIATSDIVLQYILAVPTFQNPCILNYLNYSEIYYYGN